MKTITMLFIIGVLCSCNSAPAHIRHYLLNTPNLEPAVHKKSGLPIVQVQAVNIADYLNQANLVMLLAHHELYYSRQDVWAEPLQNSFYQALLKDLNKDPSHLYVASHSPYADKASITIMLDLAHFHSTHLSTVLASGNYWVSSANNVVLDENELTISENSFYYEIDLQQDGFAHAVSQLRAAVTRLARQINQDIAAIAE